MSWFDKLLPSRIRTEGSVKKAVPEGLWNKCPGCGAILYRAEMERNLDVCPKCDFHGRIGARRRLDLFLDPEHREERPSSRPIVLEENVWLARALSCSRGSPSGTTA